MFQKQWDFLKNCNISAVSNISIQLLNYNTLLCIRWNFLDPHYPIFLLLTLYLIMSLRGYGLWKHGLQKWYCWCHFYTSIRILNLYLSISYDQLLLLSLALTPGVVLLTSLLHFHRNSQYHPLDQLLSFLNFSFFYMFSCCLQRPVSFFGFIYNRFSFISSVNKI